MARPAPRVSPALPLEALIMTIAWNPSAGPTLGVEWEVQLVDAQTRMLRQDAACGAGRAARAAGERRAPEDAS